jgi:hypothetical protein
MSRDGVVVNTLAERSQVQLLVWPDNYLRLSQCGQIVNSQLPWQGYEAVYMKGKTIGSC